MSGVSVDELEMETNGVCINNNIINKVREEGGGGLERERKRERVQNTKVINESCTNFTLQNFTINEKPTSLLLVIVSFGLENDFGCFEFKSLIVEMLFQ